MAPRDGDMATATGPNETKSSAPTSAFWSRLHTFPMVQNTIQTTMGIYTTSKEKAFIGTGLGVIEYGVNLASTPVKKVASTIAEKYPAASTTAHKLDNMALNCLDTLEKKIPVIQEMPTQIITSVKNGASNALHSGVTTVKQGASTAMHSGVRRVMKTYPGQKIVNGLDSMITWSETTIGENETQKPEDEEEEPKCSKREMITVRLRNGVVVPLKLYLHMLKLVKHMLANMAGVNMHAPVRKGQSPRKATTESRKQSSSRKHVSEKSLISSITNSAMQMIGISKTTDNDTVQDPKQFGADDLLASSNKRKLEEFDDDNEDDDNDSDAESMNLAAALEHYDLDIDSDYCPEDDPNDDSLEYNSDDTGSEQLETENVGISKTGQPLIALKCKQDKPPSETMPPAPTELSNQSDTTQA